MKQSRKNQWFMMLLALALALTMIAAVSTAESPATGPVGRNVRQQVMDYFADPACLPAAQDNSSPETDLLRPLPECWLVSGEQPEPGAD